eukprot:Em0006g1102a
MQILKARGTLPPVLTVGRYCGGRSEYQFNLQCSATHPVDEGTGGVANGGEAKNHWDQVEPHNVSKLVSMLEGQVSKLDQKLRTNLYLPSFCGSNLEKAEDTVKVRSKWRPTAIIYLTTRVVIAEQRARKTCFRKNMAEDDVSTGHSPRMRLARVPIHAVTMEIRYDVFEVCMRKNWLLYSPALLWIFTIASLGCLTSLQADEAKAIAAWLPSRSHSSGPKPIPPFCVG